MEKDKKGEEEDMGEKDVLCVIYEVIIRFSSFPFSKHILFFLLTNY